MKKCLRKRPADQKCQHRHVPARAAGPGREPPHGSRPSSADNHLLPHSASIRVANGLVLIEGFHPLHAHVLVEGTGPGDLNFAVRWLLSAAKADRLLEREFAGDPNFRTSIDRLEVSSLVEFRPPAMAFLRMYFEDMTTFTLDIENSEWAEMFVIMVAAGFFQITGDRYQMTAPKQLKISKIREALLQLAATEDKDHNLHPEEFVHVVSYLDAMEWRRRLSSIDWQQRVTDRAILLGSF
jgi:hypothetical protein